MSTHTLAPASIASYVVSVGVPQMRQLLALDGEDTRVDRHGSLDSFVETPRGFLYVEVAPDGTVTVSPEETTNDLERASSRDGLTIEAIRRFPDGRVVLDIEVEVTDDFSHPTSGVEADSFDLSRAGLTGLVDALLADRGRQDLWQYGVEDAEDTYRDPQEEARDAYLRGIGIRR